MKYMKLAKKYGPAVIAGALMASPALAALTAADVQVVKTESDANIAVLQPVVFAIAASVLGIIIAVKLFKRLIMSAT